MNDSTCPICEAVGPTIWHRHGKEYAFCRNCHLLWRIGGASLDDTTVYYRGDNPTEAIGTAKQNLCRWMLDEAEKRLGRPGRLLDVGCSRGDFLLNAQKRGWQVEGIEPVEELVQWGRDKGLTIHQGVLADLPGDVEPFDLITYWDVILLVQDPLREMQMVRDRLTENGNLFMRLRQHAIVRAMDQTWKWGGRLLLKTNPAVYHPFNYEPRTLRMLATRSGMHFEIAPSLLTAGDPYAVGKNPGIVTRLKTASDTISSALYNITGHHSVLSPSMVVWGKTK